MVVYLDGSDEKNNDSASQYLLDFHTPFVGYAGLPSPGPLLEIPRPSGH
jgi:hypothetical protein